MNKGMVVGVVLLMTFSLASAQRIPPPGLFPIPPPQIDLTDTNSVPMQVREMSVAAFVHGLQATVETTMVFHNPNPRLLEGELVFPLPDGAAVCGYGLDINGVLVDGVVVPKEKARVAFETETRRQIDPGLVEHVRGNLYRTRIYPLPGNGSRTIRLTYTTPLGIAANGDAALFLPMPRETLETLSIRIEVVQDGAPPPELGGLGDRRFEQAETLWRVESVTTHSDPTEDVWVALPRLPPHLAAIEESADGSVWFSISALAPIPATDEKPGPGSFHVLWDASGSRADADLNKEYELLTALEAESFRLTVFRDVPEPARDFKSAADLVAAVKAAPVDGGTDFEALAAALSEPGTPRAAILLFSDGIDTLSDPPVEFPGDKPMAIVSQTVADREALRQACAGVLIDLQILDLEAARARITAPPPRIAGLKGTGIAQVQGIGRPAAGRVTLLGQLTAAEAVVQIDYGTRLSDPFVLRAEDARQGRTLSTAWAAARVNQLSPRADQFEDELLALGRRHGLVSPATSLIVLESLDQWVRHEIEPPASLPDLRERWLQAMKNRRPDIESARSRHLQQLERLWKQRVEWWTTDFSKGVPLRTDKETGTPPTRPARRPSRRAAGEVEGESFEMMDMSVASWGTPIPMMADSAPMRAERVPGIPPPAPADAPPPSIQIKPWSPDVPYLKVIRNAKQSGRYDAYLTERTTWAQSPAFFLDCAEEFLKQGDRDLALRILSNLSELRIEDAALLRVYAWRLRQAGEIDRAIVLLRRVTRLRGEEPQSFRDLALALAERGQARPDKADLEEAMELFLKVAFTPWARHADSIPLFALEELNALAAWVDRPEWADGEKPAIPEYDEGFRQNLDLDIRIVMSWDADATDIDLHVVEPGGEEASFRNNRTARGGLVTRDITDGYGPEAYLIRRAPPGPYAIRAHYYGSRQQTLVGPATVAVAVFTDWGREAQQIQPLTLRLDQPRETVDVGRIVFSGGDSAPAAADFSALRPGMTPDEVRALVGEPAAQPEDGSWSYELGVRTLVVHFDAEGKLARVVEILPGGIEQIVVQ